MELRDLTRTPDPSWGGTVYRFMETAFPICRSITGDGLRETLRRIGEIIPLELTEVPSGSRVFDWTVPPEWNIRDAWVANAAGERVIDFQRSNLHVVNYSLPTNKSLTLDELRSHLHSLPQQPELIPYRTSYYAEDWGFCLSDAALNALPDGQYEAVIDSSLEPGSLTYAECVLPGSSSDEILVSAHACHPSLANDNLSGVAVATFLARALSTIDRRLTYRFLFAPGTIGAITWLARNEDHVAAVKGGLVLACVGDAAPLVYKRSRQGNTEIDRAAGHVLHGRDRSDEIIDFSPYGNDERQFCSPGFDLPVGAITRSGYDRSGRHHTSADNMSFMSAESLGDTLAVCLEIFSVLEDNAVVRSLNPKGEPQLGRRGLYRMFGGRRDQAELESALLWVMSCADGAHSLLDIAERAKLPFDVVRQASEALEAVGLVHKEPLARVVRGGRQP